MTEDRFSQPSQSDGSSIHSHALPLDISTGEAPVNEGLETLRLVAELPPPNGLEDRVRRRIELEHTNSKRTGFWSLWKPVHRLQYAGVAVLMVVIGASSWSAFRGRVQSQPVAPLEPAAPLAPSAGFGPSGAERRPSTPKPIKVPPAPKKKPEAGRAAKASPKADASQ